MKIDLKPHNADRTDYQEDRKLVDMVLEDLRAGAKITFATTGDTLALGSTGEGGDDEYAIYLMTIRATARVPKTPEQP
jgi:hypothetical protein